MQIYIDWINIKKYLVFMGISLVFMSGYTILLGQSNESVNHYPQFVVVRLASFDFFGEPEIEVIIEDAEVRPPAGSEVVINPDDVIDAYEKESESTPAVEPSPRESNPFPSAEDGGVVQRSNPNEGTTHSHSIFNDGDRRSTEERVRGWNKNSQPRPLPDEMEPTLDVKGSELTNSKEHEVVARQNPDQVALITLMPANAVDNDKVDDYKVVDAPELPRGVDNDETLLPEVVVAGHPWGDLPIADQAFLAPYWQEELSVGLYIQVLATVQPLKLRAQIERYDALLPLAITATHGRLGMMNRLLIGPLTADELGAVGMELRLQGVKDYFLVTVSE